MAHPCLPMAETMDSFKQKQGLLEGYQVAHRIHRKTTRLSRRAGPQEGGSGEHTSHARGPGPTLRPSCQGFGGQGTLAGDRRRHGSGL